MESGPWMCAGDFDEILDHSGKVGGRRRPNYLMENFQSTLEFCGLYEIDCRGPICTWNNGRDGCNFTMEKLDRVVANHAWQVRFPNVVASLDVAVFSDHLPLSINLDGSHKIKGDVGSNLRLCEQKARIVKKLSDKYGRLRPRIMGVTSQWKRN